MTIEFTDEDNVAVNNLVNVFNVAMIEFLRPDAIEPITPPTAKEILLISVACANLVAALSGTHVISRK